MYKKLKTPTQFYGFLLIELMVALAAVLLSMSILIGWHNLIIKKQTDALRQLHVVTCATSLLEQLKIDRTLRNKQRTQKDGITYNWQVKSASLDMINHIIGNADVPTYFPYVTVLASWQTCNGQEKTYSLCAGIHE